MNPTSVLILAAVFLVIGVVLDNLVRLLVKPDKPAEVKQANAMPSATTSSRTGQVELARLCQEAGTQALIVELGGRQYHRAEELSQEQRMQMKSTLERFFNWMETPLPAGEKPAFPTPAAPIPSGSPPTPAPVPSQSIKLTGLNPVEAFVNALDADLVKPDTTKSLAQQVDAVLQEKLSGSPLKDRGIRLLDVPGKGLVVMVGMDKYDGVEAVPDEQVKAVIRSAVDEWAKRSGSWNS